jgi:hypothetical protein
MLFMVIEHFKNADAAPVGERFRQHGRMMPQGVEYRASWVDPAASRCFQIMESPDRHLLDQWIAHWDDLVDFEIIPVVPSADFWSARDAVTGIAENFSGSDHAAPENAN